MPYLPLWILGIILTCSLAGLLFWPALMAVAAFLAFGTPGFWVLAVVISLWMVYWGSDYLREVYVGSSTATVILLLLFLQFFGGIKVFNFIYEHPFVFAKYFGMYFVIGAAWSVFKYWRFLINARKIVQSHGTRYGSSSSRDLEKYKFENNKSRIATWVMFWPWSFIGYFISDLIQKIADTIVDLLKGVYSRVYESVFGDLLKAENKDK